MFKLVDLEVVQLEDANKKPNMCSCGDCGWSGKISECETTTESEGWEYPEYTVLLCPKCPEGGVIDDYFYSKELEEELKLEEDNKKEDGSYAYGRPCSRKDADEGEVCLDDAP